MKMTRTMKNVEFFEKSFFNEKTFLAFEDFSQFFSHKRIINHKNLNFDAIKRRLNIKI